MIKNNKLEGIILAAGLSTRLSYWKPEVKINKLPIIVHTINSLIPYCKRIIIVGGFNCKSLKKIILDGTYFSSEEKEKINIVENEKYMNGMLSSVKTGLNIIDQQTEGIFILPGDMPFVLSETFNKLISRFDENINSDIFIPVTKINLPSNFNDEINKKGHPVLVRKRIVSQILADENEVIFRDILKKFGHELCPVEDKGIIIDINDVKDLEKAKIYYEEFLIQQRGNK
ncbi:MAG: nucleotidyltransferase family protein [Bacteroidetes bacterium]|nr:nucleotidyltransferase family protein [Bacteroidota bacterium]